MERISVEKILKADRALKSVVGDDFEEDAIKLVNLYDGMTRAIIQAFQEQVQLGDPENPRPMTPALVKRLGSQKSVLYRAPASRRLKIGGEVLLDDDPRAKAFAHAAETIGPGGLDGVFGACDPYRQILRQVLISFAESPSQRNVLARKFEPYNYARLVTPGLADSVDDDEALLLKVAHGSRPEECVYILWQHSDAGTWNAWRVNGKDELVGRQPYGDGGVSPLGKTLPVVLFTDQLPLGRPYLPLPEYSLDIVMNVSAIASDLGFIAKQEAHSLRVAYTKDKAGVPTEIGPGKTWTLDRDDRVEVLSHKPQIDAVNGIIDRALSLLALSEHLPPDAFAKDRILPDSSIAAQAQYEDLEAQRQLQIPLTRAAERLAYFKYARVWNEVNLDNPAVSLLEEDAELVVQHATSWRALNRVEHQKVAFGDMAAGLKSPVRYVMEAEGVTRSGAIELIEQAHEDLDLYPLRQNPASMIDGSGPAVGAGGAQKTPGAFHPNQANSVEGASLTAALKDRMGSDPTLGA